MLVNNIAAVMHGERPRAFRFKIFGLKYSGIFAWIMWRGTYLGKLPGLQRKARVAIDWTLDLFFSKDIVQLPTMPSPVVSAPEGTSAGADSVLSPTRSTSSQ